jgi:hypothetical protein
MQQTNPLPALLRMPRWQEPLPLCPKSGHRASIATPSSLPLPTSSPPTAQEMPHCQSSAERRPTEQALTEQELGLTEQGLSEQGSTELEPAEQEPAEQEPTEQEPTEQEPTEQEPTE